MGNFLSIAIICAAIFLGSLRSQAAQTCEAEFSPLPPVEIRVNSLNENLTAADLQKLTQHIQDAARTFQKYISESGESLINLKKPIVVNVGGSLALRTGYNMESRQLFFPDLKNVLRHGIESKEVVQHETFHLLLCRILPGVCTPQAMTQSEVPVIHEALADLFAYYIRPKELFGEGYFQNKTHIRSYKNKLIMNLTEGAHSQAEALVSLLISSEFSWNQLNEFIKAGEFSFSGLRRVSPNLSKKLDEQSKFQVQLRLLKDNLSIQKKYRLSEGEVKIFELKFSRDLMESYPDLKIDIKNSLLEKPRYYEIEVLETPEFGIYHLKATARQEYASEKIVLRFSSQNALVGAQVLYLTKRYPSP